MKKRQLILVEWEDTATYGNWRNEAKSADVTAMICQTVGWKMKSPSSKKIALTSTRNSAGECCDLTVIQKSNIRSMKRLE